MRNLKKILSIFIIIFLVYIISASFPLNKVIVLDSILAYALSLIISLIGISFIVLYLRRIKMVKDN